MIGNPDQLPLGDSFVPHDEGFPLDNIIPIQELEDGSTIFRIHDHQYEPEQPKLKSDTDFYANLADEADDETLKKIAAQLLDGIEEDKESRSGWENTISTAMQYVGDKVTESRNMPFINACAAYDNTLATAIVTSYSTIISELLPAEGPVKAHVNGVPDVVTEDMAERVRLFMNHYLTDIDEEYYPDFKQLILYVVCCGSGFKKIYMDPISNLPLARLVKPQDLIVNVDTTSLLSSERITYRFYLSKKEVMLRERKGVFKHGSLIEGEGFNDDDGDQISKKVNTQLGITKSNLSKKSLHTFYEVLVDWDSSELETGIYKPGKEDYIPRPYIITVSEDTRKVASIVRGWEENDPNFKRKTRYVHYKYMEGFGIYGRGLFHLLGSNSIVLTTTLRQQVDAATLKNFPGGIRQAGLRQEQNNKPIGPGEWLEIDTAGMPISDVVYLLPYQEPSQVLAALRQEIKEDQKALYTAAESPLPDGSLNAPVGTTLALLEVANRNISTVLRSFHFSLGVELRGLYDLFGKYLPDEPYPFNVPGKDTAIMRQDFNERIKIVPISDPNVMSSTHRLIREESVLKLAAGNPELFNMKEIYTRMLHAMKVENVEKIFVEPQPPQSLDAISENMIMLLGKEVIAKLDQDHVSHSILHKKFATDNIANPQVYAMAMMHSQLHDALQAAIENMPPEMMHDPNIQQTDVHQFLMLPEIQNHISKMDAEKLMNEQKAMLEEQHSQPKPLDPSIVMMADVEQKREAAKLKDEEAKLKAETEAMKAQLKYEGDMAKVRANQEMATEKHEVDLAIAEMKSPNHGEHHE